MKKLLVLLLILAVHSLYAGFDFSKDAGSKSLERQIVTQNIDDNGSNGGICPDTYAPVCGIINPCPEGAECFAPAIHETFINKCMLEKANAKFAYKGTCKTNQTDLQEKLDENRALWNMFKEIKGNVYSFYIDGNYDGKVIKGHTVHVDPANIPIMKQNNIDDYFDIAQKTVNKADDNSIITISYDEETGYPTHIVYKDKLVHIANANYEINIKDLKFDNNVTVCTEEYAPVCGITNPCPKGQACPAMLPIYKTFSNMCVLEKSDAEFAYEGKCKTITSYEKNITIAPKKVNCGGWTISDSQCLNLQEEGSNVWNAVHNVKGLTYEEGYRYKILAKVIKNDPGIQDISSESYELIKILKKDFVDENVTVCTEEYAPVCGITNPCPKGQVCPAILPIYKTFGNKCMLEKANAEFAYEGVCETNQTDLQKELDENRALWKKTKEAKGDVYSFYVDGFVTRPIQGHTVHVNPVHMPAKIRKEQNIDDYFDMVQYSIDNPENNTTISYDKETGYPTHIGSNPKNPNKDGGWYDINIKDLKFDDNVTACTEEYAPVCGIVTPTCPEDLPCINKQSSMYKTFDNICKLNASDAMLYHEGVCETNQTDLQKELDENRALWKKTKEAKGDVYSYYIDGYYGGEPIEGHTVHVNPVRVPTKIRKEKNIDDYFHIAQKTVNKSDDNSIITINYDKETGYPTHIGSNPKNPNIDGGWYDINIKDLKFDDNVTVCTKEYAPVCGITNPCPPGAECLVSPIYKTFSNMCMLDVANADFAYKGKCKITTTYEKNITIAPKKVKCGGWTISDSQCLNLQEEGSNVWNAVHNVKGLTYEEGYKYKILAKVTKSDIKIPEAPSKSYTLIKILKKDIVDDNVTVCTKEYAPVCGIINPCPPGAMCKIISPIYKTFPNKCMLEKANAKFGYEGVCKIDNTNLQKELDKNRALWKKTLETKGDVYSYYIDGYYGGEPIEGHTVHVGFESIIDDTGDTIDAYFKIAQGSIIDPGKTTISYDKKYGYPTHIVHKSKYVDMLGGWYEINIKNLKFDNGDDNSTVCTEEYAPVCGITNPCPEGVYCIIPPIYKTFPNKCVLKNANAKFAYEGVCKHPLNSFRRRI